MEEAAPLPGVYHQAGKRRNDRQGWGNESGPAESWAGEGAFAGREETSGAKGPSQGNRGARREEKRKAGGFDRKDWVKAPNGD